MRCTDGWYVEDAPVSLTGADRSHHWPLCSARAVCSAPAWRLLQGLCWLHPVMTAGWSLQELTLSETLHAVLPGLARLSTLTDLRALRLTKVTATAALTGWLSWVMHIARIGQSCLGRLLAFLLSWRHAEQGRVAVI